VASTERTLIGSLFMVDLEGPLRRRCGWLAAQSAGFTLVAFSIPRTLQLDFPGLISVFLLAASLRDPLVGLLDENRDRIWAQEEPAPVVNRTTSFSVLALFLGAFSGYLLISQWLLPQSLESTFGVVLDAASVPPDGSLLQHDHFGSMSSILGHNLSVMVGIFAISTVYRAYGAMLVLSWNAAVWATVLSVLGTRAVESVSASGLVAVAGAAVGILPHLTAEALGFCIAATGAIFGSVGLSKYGLGDPRLRRVMLAVGKLMLVAVGLLTVAAALEARYAPWVFGLLKTM